MNDWLTLGHAAGLEPVQRVAAVEQEEQPPFIARSREEIALSDSERVLRVGDQIREHEEQSRHLVVQNEEFALRTGDWIVLGKVDAQLARFVLDVENGAQIGSRIVRDNGSGDRHEPVAYADHVRLKTAPPRVPFFHIRYSTAVVGKRRFDALGTSPCRRVHQPASQVARTAETLHKKCGSEPMAQ
jgi:hypothetical protein